MRYVGIKNCSEKSTLIKYALKKGKKIKLKLPSITSDDCNRHFEVLRLFDSGGKKAYFIKTEYYNFNKSNGKKKSEILKKISQFRLLYKSIKTKGYNYKNGYIIITDNGIRLDGSHRASIVEHLQYPEIIALMVKWSSCFKKNQSHKILEHLAGQQRIYNAG